VAAGAHDRVATGVAPRWRSLAHACSAGLPTPIYRCLVCVPPPADSEEHLFRDVIARAVLDAIGHVSPISSKNQDVLAARCVADARAFFAAEHDPWREAMFAFANYDEPLVCALVRAEIRRLERENGTVAAPPVRESPSAPAAEMPGAAYEVVREPRRPFAVERIKRRVGIAEREAAAVIFSYLNRSATHDSAPR